MIGFRDRTFCNVTCRCSRCDLRLDEAVRRAAAAWWDDQRGPASLSVTDCSGEYHGIVPDARA